LFILSSPFLFMFGDDRAIRYARANDVTGDAGDAWRRREG